jgi:putative transposase
MATMPKPSRVNAGGVVYHVLNRANARAPIFETAGDYAAFLRILTEAHEQVPMRVLGFCLMPNHWHLVLWPHGDGDLSRFMHWTDLTHSHRWQEAHEAVGFGHLYQGRFKSFPVQDDLHYLTVCRYVLRNALRAGMVDRAEQWPWSSFYQGPPLTDTPRPAIAEGPVDLPADWPRVVNTSETDKELRDLRCCVNRGRPYGDEPWINRTASRLGLLSTLRAPGRPRLP